MTVFALEQGPIRAAAVATDVIKVMQNFEITAVLMQTKHCAIAEASSRICRAIENSPGVFH